MKYILITLVLLITGISLGNNFLDSGINEALINTINTRTVDTLYVKTISKSNVISNNIQNQMPWIVALLIGVFSLLINIFLARQLRKSNNENLKIQIENNKEISIIEFKATIASTNRQNWINELRDLTSQILSLSAEFSLLNDEDKKDVSKLNVSKLFEKLIYLKSKIELLLNSEKSDHKTLITKIDNIVSIVLSKEDEENQFSDARDEVVNAARKMFDANWKKIKNLL